MHSSLQDDHYGVIDIGSNSVRLVIFDRYRRDPVIVYNDKVSCKLGSLTKEGTLKSGSKDSALKTVRRFRMILSSLPPQNIKAIATAGLRDAKDGKAFLSLLSQTLGTPIELISGEEEAKFAAYGILCGIPDAYGVSGDLGGGSLELTPIESGSAKEGVSLPLGILRLASRFSYKDTPSWHEKATSAIRAMLKDDVSFLKQDFTQQSFYTIGGSWRAFGSFCMALHGYPLHILHEYTIDAGTALKACDMIIAGAGSARIAPFTLVPKKRWDELPYAAILLKEILLAGQFKNVVISATGIREGILYDILPLEIRKQDPLTMAASIYAGDNERFGGLCQSLYNWISPLFMEDSEELNRLRYVICLCSDTGWQYHPDYRAKVCSTQMLFNAWYGISHPQRLMLSLAVGCRYDSKFNEGALDGMESLLTEDNKVWCRRVGAALKLGHFLCGSMPHLLRKARLDHQADQIVLLMDDEMFQTLSGDLLDKRLQKLSSLFGKKIVLTVE